MSTHAVWITLWGAKWYHRRRQNDITLQMFLVCLVWETRHFQFLFLKLSVSFPEHCSPWERLHQLLLLFKFPACYKHFSMSDVETGSHPVCSPGTDLKGATKSGSAAQSSRLLVCFSGALYSCWGCWPAPSPSACACLLRSRILKISS